MSAELYSASGNNTSLQGTTVGGTKPLHRFFKGQPKITGIIVLVLGSSFFIVSIAVMPKSIEHIWAVIPPGFSLGLLFIICGILYIVTEHNPTKKTVTISLALSIVTLLVACWTILQVIPSMIHSHYIARYDYMDDNITEEAAQLSHLTMATCVEALYGLYSFVGAIILIVMSTLAGAALRSTKSQAIIVMTTTATESPVE